MVTVSHTMSSLVTLSNTSLLYTTHTHAHILYVHTKFTTATSSFRYPAGFTRNLMVTLTGGTWHQSNTPTLTSEIFGIFPNLCLRLPETKFVDMSIYIWLKKKTLIISRYSFYIIDYSL